MHTHTLSDVRADTNDLFLNYVIDGAGFVLIYGAY